MGGEGVSVTVGEACNVGVAVGVWLAARVGVLVASKVGVGAGVVVHALSAATNKPTRVHRLFMMISILQAKSKG